MDHAMFRWVVLPGVLAGLILHAYTCLLIPDGGPNAFTLSLFALSILPYLACFIAGIKNKRGALMATCAVLPLLLIDALAFQTAILAPTTSTSSLTLLVTPVIKLIILLLGFIVGWVTCALLRRGTAGKTP